MGILLRHRGNLTMQKIIEIKTKTQYPVTLDNLQQTIKDNNITSASCVSMYANYCQNAVSQHIALLRDEVAKNMSQYTQMEQDSKYKTLLKAYCKSAYNDNTAHATIDVYSLIDGYTSFVSAFTNYHAQRLAKEQGELKKLLSANKISPICQPLFLSRDYSKLYLLDDNYLADDYDREQISLIDVTAIVFEILKGRGIVGDGVHNVAEWLDNAGDIKTLGDEIARGIFEYMKNDCFVIHVV